MIKIQIIINIEIFLFILIFILTKQIDIYAIFILFTLIHELSHAIAGMILGLKIRKFCIMPFGFKIMFEESKNYKKIGTKKTLIAAIGPFTNLFIMTIAIIFDLHTNIIYSNLIIAVFNLIPIYPLDGGRALKEILKQIYKPQKANYILNKVTYITIVLLTLVTSILILYVKNLILVFTLAYLWFVVIKENKRYKLIERVYNIIEKEHIRAGGYPCSRK